MYFPSQTSNTQQNVPLLWSTCLNERINRTIFSSVTEERPEAGKITFPNEIADFRIMQKHEVSGEKNVNYFPSDWAQPGNNKNNINKSCVCFACEVRARINLWFSKNYTSIQKVPRWPSITTEANDQWVQCVKCWANGQQWTIFWSHGAALHRRSLLFETRSE